MLTHEMVKAVHESHPLKLPFGLRLLLARGRYAEVTRLDVAVLVRVPDGMSSAALVNAVALANVMAGGNMSLYANEATYGDPSSQIQAWKLYDKALELSKKGKFHLPESAAKDALPCLSCAIRHCGWNSSIARNSFRTMLFSKAAPRTLRI